MKNDYLSFIDTFEALSQRVDSLTILDRFRLLRSGFHENNAGERAAQKYRDFETDAGNGRYLQACRNFLIADFFRKVFFLKQTEGPFDFRGIAPVFDLVDLLQFSSLVSVPVFSAADGATIQILADIDDAAVFLDGQYRGMTPLNVENIVPGSHQVLVCKDGLRSFRRIFTVVENGSVEIQAVLGDAWFQLTEGPRDAEVLLDGQFVSHIPTRKIGIKPGSHTIRIQSADGYEPKTINLSFDLFEEKKLQTSLNPRTGRKAMLCSVIFPGLGQLYLQKKSIGLKFLLTEAAACTGILLAHRYVGQRGRAYDNLVLKYEGVYGERLVDISRHNMDDIKEKEHALREMEDVRTVLVGVAAGAWLWSVINAGLYEEKPQLAISGNYDSKKNTYLVGLSLNF